MAAAPALVLLLTLLVPASADPKLTKLVPPRGYNSGGYRVRLEGFNLAFLPEEITVIFGMLECKNVRVEKPWQALSCEVPGCPHCTDVQVKVNLGGVISNALPYTYTGICEGLPLIPRKPPIKLPAEYSAEENCTICETLVTGALNAVPDLVSYESLRVALRDTCGSPLIRNFHTNDAACKKKVRDYFVPVRAEAMGPRLRLESEARGR